MKRILTIFFLVSIKCSRHKERTKDDNHEGRATDHGGMEGVGEDRVGEKGDAR